MKQIKKTSVVFLFAVIAVLGMAPSSVAKSTGDGATLEEVKTETKDLLEALKSYSVQQRDVAVEKTRAAMERLDQRVDALEAQVDQRWEKMSESARREARASLKELRKQRAQVAEWYGGLKNSSADAWDHVKQGFTGAYTELQTAWEKAEKELRSGE